MECATTELMKNAHFVIAVVVIIIAAHHDLSSSSSEDHYTHTLQRQVTGDILTSKRNNRNRNMIVIITYGP